MKVRFTLSIGMIGKREEVIDIGDDGFADLEGEALQESLNEEWQTWAWNYIDGGATIVEDE